MPEEKSLKKDFIDTGLIKNIKVWCFGYTKDPKKIPTEDEVEMAGGGKMFDVAATLSFECPKAKDTKSFKFVFCAKKHSKIGRRDPANKSSWYIWQPVGESGCIVLSIDKFKEMTGVDIYGLVRTPEFAQLQQQFKKIMGDAIEKAIAEYGKSESTKAIEEAVGIVAQFPVIMDKTYKLINYDHFTDELKKQGYGDELTKRGETMTQHHREVGTKFVDKVKQNALKAGEQERAIQHDLKNK